MKVAKEEIVGLVAAVDWFLKQDDAAWKRSTDASRIGSPDIWARFRRCRPKSSVLEVANHVPLLLITYDQIRVKIKGAEIKQKMREGRPYIELDPSTGGASASAGLAGGPNTIVVGVWMLQPGEDTIVARRLREVLQTAMKV